MSQKINFALELELDFFELEEIQEARAQAERQNAVLYCWKTIGRENWLEQGVSICDVLGIVLLPKGLPPVIDLPDDPPDEDAGDVQ